MYRKEVNSFNSLNCSPYQTYTRALLTIIKFLPGIVVVAGDFCVQLKDANIFKQFRSMHRSFGVMKTNDGIISENKSCNIVANIMIDSKSSNDCSFYLTVDQIIPSSTCLFGSLE